MFLIQSCSLYGDMEKRMARNSLCESMKARSDFERRFSSAFTSIGIMTP